MSVINQSSISQMKWDTERDIVHFDIDGTGIVGYLILSRSLDGDITVRMAQATVSARVFLGLWLRERPRNSLMVHSC
jgi:hypothetical protein